MNRSIGVMIGILSLLPVLPSCQESAGDQALAEAMSINADWLYERVLALSKDDMEGRENLTPGGERARAYLVGELETIGVQPAGVDGWHQAFPEGVNVIGLIPGTDADLSGEYVAIGAHYDHLGVAGVADSACSELDGDLICNGAADNATGCAAVLAIARTLIEGAGPRRSVLVLLFDAEEDGLLGSRHFAMEEPTVALDSLVAFCNIDTIGTSIIPGDASSFVLGVEYTSGLRELVWELNEKLQYNNNPVSSFFDGSEEGGRSDHYPFRLMELPSIFFGSGSPPEYHTPADEIGIVDMGKFLQITRHAFLMTRELAGAEWRPGFVADPAPHIDDAVALVALGERVQADPEAAGLDDPTMLALLDDWMARLRGYIDSPPVTREEWDEYDDFIRTVVRTVYLAFI
jgi:hypothetical protein